MKRQMTEFSVYIYNCHIKKIDEWARIIYNKMKYIKQRGDEFWLR